MFIILLNYLYTSLNIFDKITLNGVISMKDIINSVVGKNINLFGNNPSITKINIGFSNTVYNINDTFIVKICTNPENEENFKNEINFYNSNLNNSLIPKMYYSDIEKKDIPYCYEILEKVDGVSLYNVWHNLSEQEREYIIKQICVAMKQFHSNTLEKYDWFNYFKNKFSLLYSKAMQINIFNEEEQHLINHAYSKFDRYLNSKDFVLVHNDLHFDNILYSNGKIKLIDFERSMFAPKDFELDIFFRMVRKPWKFASEETEQYTNSGDYSSIKLYVEKYYPELVNIPFLSQRLAIYDMVYFLNQLIDNPDSKELKEDVINASKIVALKDELNFEHLESAQQLMDYMDINIEYGWIDKFGQKHLNNLKRFRENYRISPIDEIIKKGIGTCIEQAKLIKQFFDNIGLENKLYCYRRYETEENFDKEVRMHCFLLFHYQDSWYHFEHANFNKKGIHKYDSPDDAIKAEIDRHDENDIRELVEIPCIPDLLTFKQFNQYVNTFEPISINKSYKKI